MKVLLDTNIILDIFLNRQPFAQEAEAIWTANANCKIEAFISAITVPTIYYVARKAGGRNAARYIVRSLLSSVGIAGVNYTVLLNAESLPISDYEDAIQIASAQSEKLDAIVTRDLKDFQDSPLPVYTPSDFIALISATKQ